MRVRQILLDRISAYCRGAGISERKFGADAVQDGRLVERLREGKATLKVMERAEAFIESAPRPRTASVPQRSAVRDAA